MPLTDRDRRTLKIGGIVAGVLLLGVLLMQVLGGGGDDDALPTTTPSEVPTGSETPSPTLTTSPTPPPTPVGVFTGRDPFSIPGIFGVSTTTTTTSGTTTSSGTTTTSSGTTTSSSTGSSSSSSPPPTQPGNGSSTTVGGHQVVLLDVFVVNGVDTAQVEVDGTISNVSEGESFGPGDQFELRSISGNCGSFLYGDESFTLCVTPQK